MDLEKIKQAAGYQAANFVKKGMTVGLGTGSTTYYFIERLIQKNQEQDLNLKIVASSIKSSLQAQKGGLRILDINEITSVDLTVDGADELDPQKRMIKGGGGALLREKILANMSEELIIVIDETKKVEDLGKRKLPVEVVPFGSTATLYKIQKRGLSAQFRLQSEFSKEKYITDNGNYLIDIQFKHPIKNPEKEHSLLKEIPGVIETGFFFHLAGRVIVAFLDGQITIIP